MMPPLSFVLGVLVLCKVMLLQQRRDFVRTPQVVVYFALLRLTNCGKLDCKNG